MKTLQEITEILNTTEDSKVIDLWNDYQSEISGEGRIYTFDEDFFEQMFSDKYQVARAVFMGEIESWANDYIKFNGYGNLESISNPIEMLSVYDLANYINDNQDDFTDFLDTE